MRKVVVFAWGWGALVASAEIAGCLSSAPQATPTSSDASPPGEDSSSAFDSAAPNDAAQPSDTSIASDAGTDSTLPQEAGDDASQDAGQDAAQDAGQDAAQDAGQDAAADATADAPPDAPPDAALDAGAGSTVIASGFSAPFAFTLDSTNLYFTTDIGDIYTIGLADIGGTPVKLATLQMRPTTLALAGGDLYWMNYGQFGQINGSLVKLPLVDGGTLTTIASPLQTPEYFAVTPSGIFWGNANDVNELLPDGGVSRIATYAAQFPPAVVAVAADTTNVYWTISESGPRGLLKAPLGGGAATMLTNTPIPNGPVGNILVDSTNVYYQDGVNLWSVPIDAPDAASPGVLLATVSGMKTIATDGTRIYFTTSSAIMSVPIGGLGDGGAPTFIADASGLRQARWIVVDSTYVYWGSGTNTTDGAVLRALKQ